MKNNNKKSLSYIMVFIFIALIKFDCYGAEVSQNPIMNVIKDAPAGNIVVTQDVEVVSTDNVADILQKLFPIFYAALVRAGYITAIKNATAITIFAPEDAAFAKFKEIMSPQVYESIFEGKTVSGEESNEGMKKLQEILNQHIFPNKSVTSDLFEMGALRSAGSKKINVVNTASGVKKIDDTATIVDADIVGTNGVIHAINEVLVP